ASALAAAWQTQKVALQGTAAYLKAWKEDIDKGLRAWPDFGRRMGETIFFCREPDMDAAKAAAQDFMIKYGLSMCGAPDAVGENLALSKQVWEMVPKQIRDTIDLFQTDPVVFFLEKAWGLTWDYLKRPEVHFDAVMNNPPGARTTLQAFNRDALKIRDAGSSTGETYDWLNIPAMVNTVTMTKLTWLSEAGLRKLLEDLEERGDTSNTMTPLITIDAARLPSILGFISSLDHSDQWCAGDKLLFVQDPCVYRKLFVRQLGEEIPGCLGNCETPPDGSVISQPIEFPLAAGFKDFDVFVDKSGKVWQFGEQHLADGSRGPIQKEYPIPSSKEEMTSVVQAGLQRHPHDNVLALRNDGTVWAWGKSAHGSAGLWETKDPFQPLQLPNLKSIVQLATGTYHYLALRSNGQVWAWGDNSRGQIGWGKKAMPARPHRVPNLNNVKFVAAGDWTSFAITTDGSLWAWGENSFGNLGDGTQEDRYAPAKVPGMARAKMVAAGHGHTLVLKEDGTVWAWGQNSDGEVGNGQRKVPQLQPAQIQGLSDIISISAESFHSTALKKDGTVWVWGRHNLSQPGFSGQPFYSERPIQVKGIPRIVAVACGEDHTLALDRDGFVWTWGASEPVPKKIAGLRLF
ncbi:MAG: hypothetical protein ABIN58_02485, partial [candidate division WOR-3 bacterium]